jgi:hypothetical protein
VNLHAVKAKRARVYVSSEPCSPLKDPLPVLGSIFVNPEATPNFMVEVFVPQGSTGYLCGVALDEQDRVVGVASAEKNPMRLEGEGEVSFSGLAMVFQPLDSPRPMPSGFR